MAQAEPGEATQIELEPAVSDHAHEFALERYRYILQQIHTVNENAYRFLAIYQTLATSLATGALALFVGYRKWGVSRAVARDGVIGILLLITVVAVFTAVLLIVGVLTWLDYRHEEADLTDRVVHPGFRARPQVRNVLRWYELYIVAFIVVSVIVLWLIALLVLLPAMT